MGDVGTGLGYLFGCFCCFRNVNTDPTTPRTHSTGRMKGFRGRGEAQVDKDILAKFEGSKFQQSKRKSGSGSQVRMNTFDNGERR